MRSAAVAAGVLLLLAGCASRSSGQAAPASTSGSSPTTRHVLEMRQVLAEIKPDSGLRAAPSSDSAEATAGGCTAVMTGSSVAACETPKVAHEVTALRSCPHPTDAVPDDPTQPMAACDRSGTVIYLLAPAAMNGDDLKVATAQHDETQGYLVDLTFTGKGSSDFATLTGKVSSLPAPRNQLAVVVGGVVASAPRIDLAITGGDAQITGGTAAPLTKADVSRLVEQINGTAAR